MESWDVSRNPDESWQHLFGVSLALAQPRRGGLDHGVQRGGDPQADPEAPREVLRAGGVRKLSLSRSSRREVRIRVPFSL